jgi:ABC-type Fe3+/spermidine/putrescine transport system ATPase subunit
MTLRVSELRFERKGFALGPLDLEAQGGRMVVLIGPSGGGKTTLLRLLAGLEAPSGGSITLGDTLFSGEGAFVPAAARRVGFVFQGLALWPHMKALAQVRFAGKCGKREAAELLLRAGLPASLHKRLPGALSGGEAQRLAIARALAGQPRLLLLDEPLRSVDPHLREDLQRTLRKLAREERHPSICVTHDREEALALADDLIVLAGGKILERGQPEELCRAPRHAFTARFLLRAGILPLQGLGAKRGCPLGSFSVPDWIEGKAALALLPGDLRLSLPNPETPEAKTALVPVLDRHFDERGCLLEIDLEGQPFTVLLHPGEPIPDPGMKVRIQLTKPPLVVSADGEMA